MLFQGPFLFIVKMQDVEATIHKMHKDYSVAAEKPFSFLGTLSVDKKSCIQTMQHFRKKCSLFIHSLHLIIRPLTSIEGVKRTEFS